MIDKFGDQIVDFFSNEMNQMSTLIFFLNPTMIMMIMSHETNYAIHSSKLICDVRLISGCCFCCCCCFL